MASGPTFTDVYGGKPEDETTGAEIPSLYDPRDSLLRWICKEKKAASHVSKWRASSKTAFRFVDGHQVSEADASALKAAQRPDNAFNSAQKFIRFVTGIERAAPEALIFNPLDENDTQQQMHGEFLTRCYDWAMAKGDGLFERSRAFYDCIVGGMGWMDYYIDRSRDPRGLPAMNRIDPMEMYWPDIDRQNLAGSRWRARETKIDIEEAINRWPDQEHIIIASSAGQVTGGSPFPTPDDTVVFKPGNLETELTESGRLDYDDDAEVNVLEWQWYDEELGYYFADPGEQADVWLPDKDFRAYRGNLIMQGIKITDYVRQVRRVHKKVFILNDQVRLGEVIEIPGNRFTFNCMTGHWDQDRREWYGYMRILMDPQQYANKFFNQVIEVMGHQAKGGLLYEAGAIQLKQVEEINANYTKPGTSQEVAPGALANNQIRDKPMPQLPAAYIAVMDFCIKSMDQVTGLSPEAAFNGSVADTPGVTLRQKQQSSLLLLSQEFGALSRFRIEEGKIIFDLLGLIADDRLIKVGGAFDGGVIKLLQQPFALEYEIALDDTERDPNIRRMYTENIMALAPTLIRMNKFLPEILDYMTIPVKFREALKNAIRANAQAEMERSQAGIQPAGRGTPQSPEERAGKVAKLQADTQLQQVKAQRVEGQRRRDETRTIMEAIVKTEQIKLEKQKLMLESVRVSSDNKRAALDFSKSLITEAMKDDTARENARKKQTSAGKKK